MRKYLLIAVLAVLPFLAEAQNGPAIARIVCGPYLQNVTTDSFTVMWMTDVDAVGWVEIAPDNEENFYYKDRPKYYDMRGHGLKPIGKIHKVTIGGLKPGTSYRYRVMMTAVQDYYNNYNPVYGKGSGAPAYKVDLPKATTLKRITARSGSPLSTTCTPRTRYCADCSRTRRRTRSSTSFCSTET